MTVIETNGLTKRFDGMTAVDDLTLIVEDAEIYGFLGPNGAGKTTTINSYSVLSGDIRLGAGPRHGRLASMLSPSPDTRRSTVP